jgi:hypothetical protein
MIAILAAEIMIRHGIWGCTPFKAISTEQTEALNCAFSQSRLKTCGFSSQNGCVPTSAVGHLDLLCITNHDYIS